MSDADHMDAWHELSNGKPFHAFAPSPGTITLEVVACALSKLCRFGGHTARFYSVAEHAVRVSYLVEKEAGAAAALDALHHDDAEALVPWGDMLAPYKQLPCMEPLVAAERKVDACVRIALGLPAKPHPAIKRADIQMLLTEARDLMPSKGNWDWAVDHQRDPAPVTGHQPPAAERMFIERHRELKGKL